MARKLSSFLGALLIVVAAPASAQASDPSASGFEQSEKYTLKEWSSLGKKERQGLVLASIESLFLAMADYPQEQGLIQADCLSGLTPKYVEKVIYEISKEKPDLPFVDTFLAVTQCYGEAAR